MLESAAAIGKVCVGQSSVLRVVGIECQGLLTAFIAVEFYIIP